MTENDTRSCKPKLQKCTYIKNFHSILNAVLFINGNYRFTIQILTFLAFNNTKKCELLSFCTLFVTFTVCFLLPFQRYNVFWSSITVSQTFIMGVDPAASSCSACRIERKVSEPSNPRPDKKAPITGITDSSRASQPTKSCRYCSRKTLGITTIHHLFLQQFIF